jgi:hypothetical protein
MKSQKNNSLKYCIKCGILLDNSNWIDYLKTRSNYICTTCYREYGKNYHKSDTDYSKKQRNRTRSRRSAVIFSYGNQCAYCAEDDYYKLTIDHINNDGGKHRKEMVGNIIDHLYNNIVQKDGYQVLCYNCNCSKNISYKDKYNLINKKKVLDHYGNQCSICSEGRVERLTIDHINNDGVEQRKKLKCGTGAMMYRWLINKNYPDDLGLQVLCYNCNCSKISIIKEDNE